MIHQTFPYYSENIVYNNGKSYHNLLFDEGLENNASGGYSYQHHLKDCLRNTNETNNPIGYIANTAEP